MNKLKTALGNGFWQLLPSIGTMLLSLLFVRMYDAATWGNIVGVIVVQQILNSIISWGNRDFLQREIATNHNNFKYSFSALLQERFFVFTVVMVFCYKLDWISYSYFTSLTLLVFAKFMQQSIDVIVLKEKRFVFVCFLEIVFLIFQILLLIYLWRIGVTDPYSLFTVLWLPAILKSIVLIIVFHNYFVFKITNGTFLRKSMFFGLITFSGLVHSKIDMLLISKLLDNASVGKYHIIMAFLWTIQSVAMYVSGPFVHNFYRLNESAQLNYANFLRRLSYWIVPIGVLSMIAVLYFMLNIAVSISIVIAALLFSVASFIYLPWVFKLNQRQQENRVLVLNVIGIGLLVGFILSVYHFDGLTLERTIWIVTIHQFFISLMAWAANNIKA